MKFPLSSLVCPVAVRRIADPLDQRGFFRAGRRLGRQILREEFLVDFEQIVGVEVLHRLRQSRDRSVFLSWFSLIWKNRPVELASKR